MINDCISTEYACIRPGDYSKMPMDRNKREEHPLFTYEEAVNYIEDIPKFTTKNKLEHTKDCLVRLGSPDKKMKIVHVAGTNGKGSVCAFLSSMLGEGGYKVGLFTSPHLVKINERFQLNEVPVSDETFLNAFCKVKELADTLVEEGSYHPTYFEFLFLMGMIIFAEEQVDYLVLETGLGGRMDATNSVAQPIACVITSISLDHVEYLGDTITAIAGEKAGIIKPGVPVIFDANDKEAACVLQAKAQELGSPFYAVDKSLGEIQGITANGIDFSYQCEHYGKMQVSIPFVARYQAANASLAMETMGVLAKEHNISAEAVQAGMKNTRWQGRMETILPGVIVDGAHNEDGVERFIETARDFQDQYKITLLFSAVKDKDYQDMIGHICEELKFYHVVTTEIWGDRIVPADELAEVFRQKGCQAVTAVASVEEAFEEACRQKEDGLLFCVGSLYLVGEIKAYLRSKKTDEEA